MAISKGCEQCRASKIRCDVVRPACSRCVRTGRQCRYRDLSDLHFRDQTKEVMLKQAKATAGGCGRKQTGMEKKRKGVPLFQSGVVMVAETSGRLLPMAIPRTLPGDVQVESISCFVFLYRFVNLTSLIDCSSPIDLDYANCALPLGRRALVAAAVALGKVALANSKHAGKDSALRVGSLKDNMAALRLLRHAMVTVDRGKEREFSSDAAVTAVMLLSLFELFISPREDSYYGWCSHLVGAQQMLEQKVEGSRAQHQFPLYSMHGWRCQQMLLALMRQTPVAPVAIKTHKRILETSTNSLERLSARLCLIMSRLAALQHRVMASTATDDGGILAEAAAIGAELDNWREALPAAEFRHELVVGDETAYVVGNGVRLKPYRGCWHRYRGALSSLLWNHYRSSMLLLLEIVFERDGFQPQLVRLRDAMARDICLSVPDTLGLGDDDGQIIRGGLSLLWPLWVAGQSSIGNDEQFEWLDHCLLAIGRGIGIYSALSTREYLINLSEEFRAVQGVRMTADDKDESGEARCWELGSDGGIAARGS